jgi:hypothetical protein
MVLDASIGAGSEVMVLHSEFFSLLIVLVIFAVLTGFGALVQAVICRFWGEEYQEAAHEENNHEKKPMAKEPPIQKAA